MEQPKSRPTADAIVQGLLEGRSAAEAAGALAELAVRTVAELQRLARREAEAQRGQPTWGAWAKLANAARTGALQMASCRDAAREVARRGAEPPA